MSALDMLLWELLGDDLDASAFPLPPPIPRDMAPTVPPGRAS